MDGISEDIEEDNSPPAHETAQVSDIYTQRKCAASSIFRAIKLDKVEPTTVVSPPAVKPPNLLATQGDTQKVLIDRKPRKNSLTILEYLEAKRKQ